MTLEYKEATCTMDPIYVERMKEWVDIDNKLMKLKDQVQELNEEKKDVEEDILKYVETKGLDKVTVNISDGTLKFPKRSTQQSISLKYLKNTLAKYSEEKQDIDAEELYKFLVGNLETKTKMFIKRDIR